LNTRQFLTQVLRALANLITAERIEFGSLSVRVRHLIDFTS